MRRLLALFLLSIAAGCYTQTSNRPVPAAIVNDACAAGASPEMCGATAGCEWRAITSDCPSGATCPEGVCVTPDACAALADEARCEADTHCAWSGLRAASAPVGLCPVGQSCVAGGYCHARGASGGGCTCVQPIACPADAACPAVECDCSNPPTTSTSSTGTGGGGGTCTCACPTCAPGETCAPCTCDCGGSGGGSCGGGAAGGTCTCACPTCAAGQSCPPCDCACGTGNVGVSNTPTTTTMVGSPSPDTASDPCAGHGDATVCRADTANACSWIELGIVCVTSPCPSGACVRVKPVPDGGAGGCGCACPACVAGQTCPPCACDCCGRAAGIGPVPDPVPPPPPA